MEENAVIETVPMDEIGKCEYNTSRNPLVIREYGRNIQRMIEKVMQIEDYTQRTQMAKAIVKTMSQLNPESNDQNKMQSLNDYWHKLWDHLFIISNYQLDVDSPFPKPEPKKITKKEFRSNYSKGGVRYRSYGRNIENVIQAIAEMPDSQEKSLMGASIANHLKRLHIMWNKASVDDKTILKQFAELSEGKILLPENFQLDSTHDIVANNNSVKSKNNGNNKKSKFKNVKKKKNSNESN